MAQIRSTSTALGFLRNITQTTIQPRGWGSVLALPIIVLLLLLVIGVAIVVSPFLVLRYLIRSCSRWKESFRLLTASSGYFVRGEWLAVAALLNRPKWARRQLKKGALPTARLSRGKSAIGLAVESRRYDVLFQLLEANPDPKENAKALFTLLEGKPKFKEVGRFFDLTNVDWHFTVAGRTFLDVIVPHMGTRWVVGELPILTQLVDAGVRFDGKKQSQGFIWACRWLRPKHLIELLRAGADSRAMSDRGGPLHVLDYSKPLAEVAARVLLDGGADPCVVAAGTTPLHEAAFGGNRLAAEMLLDCGAAINAQNSRGRTPLDIARDRGEASSPLYEFLLSRGGTRGRIDDSKKKSSDKAKPQGAKESPHGRAKPSAPVDGDSWAYDALRITPPVSHVVIKKSYRKLVMECHPDRTNSLPVEQQHDLMLRFREGQEAYEHLKAKFGFL